MPAKPKKAKAKIVKPKARTPKAKAGVLPVKVKSEKIEAMEEEFRPPRIPKFLMDEEVEVDKKKKKSKEIADDIDNEPVYTDDYDNTIYSTEY